MSAPLLLDRAGPTAEDDLGDGLGDVGPAQQRQECRRQPVHVYEEDLVVLAHDRVAVAGDEPALAEPDQRFRAPDLRSSESK